jgi:hypothetical protein
MKSIWVIAAILSVTIAFAGCKYRKEEPVPGPRAGRVETAQMVASAKNPGVPPTGSHGLGTLREPPAPTTALKTRLRRAA